MAKSTLEIYLDGWSNHCRIGSDAAEVMVSATTEWFVYSDVNGGQPYRGADGIRQLCSDAAVYLPDAEQGVEKLIVSGDDWAMRWYLRGTHPDTKRPYHVTGASIGRLDVNGKVATQTDYWNITQIAAQAGAGIG